jgi:hypothetical protein
MMKPLPQASVTFCDQLRSDRVDQRDAFAEIGDQVVLVAGMTADVVHLDVEVGLALDDVGQEFAVDIAECRCRAFRPSPCRPVCP